VARITGAYRNNLFRASASLGIEGLADHAVSWAQATGLKGLVPKSDEDLRIVTVNSVKWANKCELLGFQVSDANKRNAALRLALRQCVVLQEIGADRVWQSAAR
jgi:hypothetical protein